MKNGPGSDRRPSVALHAQEHSLWANRAWSPLTVVLSVSPVATGGFGVVFHDPMIQHVPTGSQSIILLGGLSVKQEAGGGVPKRATGTKRAGQTPEPAWATRADQCLYSRIAHAKAQPSAIHGTCVTLAPEAAGRWPSFSAPSGGGECRKGSGGRGGFETRPYKVQTTSKNPLQQHNHCDRNANCQCFSAPLGGGKVPNCLTRRGDGAILRWSC